MLEVCLVLIHSCEFKRILSIVFTMYKKRKVIKRALATPAKK